MKRVVRTVIIALVCVLAVIGIIAMLIQRKNNQIPEPFIPETTTEGQTSSESEMETQFEDVRKSEDLKYTLTDDQTAYIVTGIGTCMDKDVVIPSIYKGKPVVAIGEGAFAGVTIQTVSFSKNIQSIGANAFLGCKDLEIYFYGSKADWKAISKQSDWSDVREADGYSIFVTETSEDDWGITVG